MRLVLPILLLLVATTCTSEKTKISISETISSGDNTYRLVKDNLYIDPSGQLYLKTYSVEEGTGEKEAVWIVTVFCKGCWTATEQGWKDITTLNDFVDTTTFHHSYTDTIQGGDVYKDKNYSYFHKWMADGGTLTRLND